METVQNALQVSFLVKENMIAIENGGDDGLPLVYIVPNPKGLAENESAQAICSIDVSFCEVCTSYLCLYTENLFNLCFCL